MPPPEIPTSPVAATQKSGLAVASLILGICGIVLCLGPLAGIPAVICGHIAHSKIKKAGGTLTGTGLATAGLITGYVSILMIFMMGLLAAIAIPNFVRARKAAQANACIMNLKAIEGAKAAWAQDNKKTDNDLPTDADLFGPDKSMLEKPVCPAGGTYKLGRVNEKPVCTIPEHAL